MKFSNDLVRQDSITSNSKFNSQILERIKGEILDESQTEIQVQSEIAGWASSPPKASKANTNFEHIETRPVIGWSSSK